MIRADLTGKRFNKLTVLNKTDEHGKNSNWLCICDCGKTIIRTRPNLRRSKTSSCGCSTVETIRKRFITHGKSYTKTFRCWGDVKTRCLNPKSKNYVNYGAKGVTISDEWRDSFECFLRDMGERPEGFSIERLDNDKGYCKENCIWIERGKQKSNQKRNFFVIENGEKITAMESWKRSNQSICYKTYLKRLKQNETK